MPAPLAKGLIIGISVVVAAGVAAHENPQVREWVDVQRRKIAALLHQLGDRIAPPQNHRQQARAFDMSMTQDGSEAAEHRRRQALEEIRIRQEIMEEKARLRNMKRANSSATSRSAARNSGASFDTLVDENGVLKVDNADKTTAVTSATEILPGDVHSRREQASGKQPAVSVDTDVDQKSFTIGNLTPTSDFPDPDISVPEYPEMSQTRFYSPASSPAASRHSGTSSDSFFYAAPAQEDNDQSASIHTPVMSPFADPVTPSSAPSLAGSIDHLDDAQSVDDVQSLASDGDVFTPNTWSDVGSVVSGSERDF